MHRYLPLALLVACAAEDAPLTEIALDAEREISVDPAVSLDKELYGDDACEIYFGLVSGEYDTDGTFSGIFTDYGGTVPLAFVEGTVSADLTFTGTIDAGGTDMGTMSGDFDQNVFKADIAFPGVTAGVTSGAWAVDEDGQGVWLGSWVACI